jgi:hypothetical protein
MSEPQDPLCVAVGDLLPVAVAKRGRLDAGYGFVEHEEAGEGQRVGIDGPLLSVGRLGRLAEDVVERAPGRDCPETGWEADHLGVAELAERLDRVRPRTAMSEGLPEAVVNNSLGRQVIHRMAEPDDIAGSVLILAADQAGWITGQTIMANGGNSFGL